MHVVFSIIAYGSVEDIGATLASFAGVIANYMGIDASRVRVSTMAASVRLRFKIAAPAGIEASRLEALVYSLTPSTAGSLLGLSVTDVSAPETVEPTSPTASPPGAPPSPLRPPPDSETG